MEHTLWDHSRRIVFEHGVTAVKDSAWRCICADEGAEVPLAAITQTNRLSPVLVELENPSPDPIVLLLPNDQCLLPNTQSRMLDIEIQLHELLPQLATDGKQSEFLSVVYTAANGVYHCKRMAESYATIVSRFAARPLVDSERVIFSDNPEPFFEFDALISAAMRTLDALRRPLWRLYGNPGSVPSSFKKTVDACKRIPDSLKQISRNRGASVLHTQRNIATAFSTMYRRVQSVAMRMFNENPRGFGRCRHGFLTIPKSVRPTSSLTSIALTHSPTLGR